MGSHPSLLDSRCDRLDFAALPELSVRKFLGSIAVLLFCVLPLCAQQQGQFGGGGGGSPTGTAGNALGCTYPNPCAGQPIAPNQNVWYVSTNCGAQMNCTEIKGTGKFSNQATFTNASGAVMLPANAPAATASDVGTDCWGTTWPGGTGSYRADTVQMALGTVSSVTDSTHITCSTTWGTTSGVGTFAWGDTDETATVQSAYTSAWGTGGPCPAVEWGQAIVFVSGGFANSYNCIANFPSRFGGVTNEPILSTFSLAGVRQTIFVMMPTFSFSHATSCTGNMGDSENGCFFSVRGLQYTNFTITGLGFENTTAPANTALLEIGIDSWPYQIDLEQIGGSDTNLIGWYADPQSGAYIVASSINEAGGIGLYTTSGGAGLEDFIAGNKYSAAVIAGGEWDEWRGFYQGNGCSGNLLTTGATVNVKAGAIFNATATHVDTPCTTGSTDQSGLEVSGTAYVTQGLFNTTGGVANAFSVLSGGVAYSSQSVMAGGAAGRGLNVATGGIYYDNGGNSVSGSLAAITSGKIYGILPVPVANLGTCDAAHAGYRANVTDANATTYLSTVAGGGTNKVSVTCNGTNWVIE